MNTINLITSIVAFCLYFLKVKIELNCTYLKQKEEQYVCFVFCRTMPEEG